MKLNRTINALVRGRALVLALALAGCGAFDNGAVAVDATETKHAPKLAGKWQGEIDSGAAANSDDPAAAFAKGMEQMLGAMIELEFPSEDRFRLSMMGLP